MTPIILFWLVLAALIGLLFGWWGRGRQISGRELTLKRRFDNRVSAIELDARQALERARVDAKATRRRIEAERDTLRARLGKLDPQGSGRIDPSRRAGLPRTRQRRPRTVRAVAGDPPASGMSAESDDLTQIKGIGPTFEARLNELGYKTYLDLARWTSEDLDALGAGLGARIRLKEWSDRAAELHVRKYGA